MRIIKLQVLTLLVAAAAISCNADPATGTGRQNAYHRQGVYDTPKLSNSLAVAKSPLEPVTMALVVEDLSDDILRETRNPQSTTLEPITSTRSVESSTEQDQTATMTPIPLTTKDLVESSASDPPTTEKAIITETTIPTENTPVSSEVTTEVTETTTSKIPEATTLTSTTTTTTTVASESIASDIPTEASLEKVADKDEEEKEKPKLPSPTTESPSEVPVVTLKTDSSTTPGEVVDVSPGRVETTSSPEKSIEELYTTTVTQETTSSAPVISSTEAPQPQPQPEMEPEGAAPTQTSGMREPEVTAKPVETTTMTSTAASPSATSSLPISGVPEEVRPPLCSHLPTYEPEEIQRVFREETTYRNGTIKGKFTYINFDQRYRLVHYTRLPYGPVKIDEVEELGKPESPTNQRPSGSNGEVPNAVLQLRNILPNSLFGFPFIGPQPIPRRPGEYDRSYLYSTSSISNPTLPASTPVLSLSEQRRSVANIPMGDTLGPSYLENLPVGTLVGRLAIATSAPSEKANFAPKRPTSLLYDSQPPVNSNQFQYSLSTSHHVEQPEQKRTLPLMYNFVNHSPNQYQYSPLPVYSVSSIRTHEPIPMSRAEIRPQEHENIFSSYGHQSYQPPRQEHYIAPFMFAQQSLQSNIDQQGSSVSGTETPKLKLRVKTSRNLQAQHRSDNLSSVKSAQLRESSNFSPSNTASSRPQRQRLGKQNQDLKEYPINGSPIVYHVLRHPASAIHSPAYYSQRGSRAVSNNRRVGH